MKVDCGREVRRLRNPPAFRDAHDLAVETFGDAVRDPMLHESEHTIAMTLEDSARPSAPASSRERVACYNFMLAELEAPGVPTLEKIAQ